MKKNNARRILLLTAALAMASGSLRAADVNAPPA